MSQYADFGLLIIGSLARTLNFNWRFSGFFTLVGLSCVFVVNGQTFKPQQIAFFEKKIRPLLARHCYECHSVKKIEGGLRLDHREGFLKGGASGKPVALPESKLGKTRLFQVVRLKQVEKERIHPPL
ncbi:uncharacterized protein METZ01_LOCUS488492, partial [marine metagenome]